MSDRGRRGRVVLSGAALAVGLWLSAPRAATAQYLAEAIHYFATDGSEGSQPDTELIPFGGDLYGICPRGGEYGDGTIFKVTPAGAFTKIYDFQGDVEGRFPLALVDGGDGNLYGLNSGSAHNGTFYPGFFYRLSPDGTETTMYVFDFDQTEGVLGPSSLIRGSDGNFYGTAWQGGDPAFGTLYRLTPAGSYTKLHEFGAGGPPEGVFPTSLVEAGPGNLYGTTAAGGENGYGTIFQITADGTGFRVVHSFAESDGGVPGGGYTAPRLVHASDGTIYGTTSQYGSFGAGTIWSLSASDEFHVLHHLQPATDGSLPFAGLFQADDGNLYGSASAGGEAGTGLLFQLTLPGTYTPFNLFREQGTDGAAPYSSPIQGPDGKLYGVTHGGNFGVGVIYRSVLPPSVQSIDPTSGAAGGGTVLVIAGTNYDSATQVQVADSLASSVTFVGPNEIDAATPELAPGTLNDVTLFTDDWSSTLPNAFFADFLDVPQNDIFHAYIEKIFRRGITAGVGGGTYGRADPVRRDQMAVFLLKSEHGSDYVPPPCLGVFPDVPCPSAFASWIEQLRAEAITGGCGTGENYCPSAPVTREQMSVFLLKTEHGAAYVPPACTGIFEDVPCTSDFAPWIEQLSHENVTGGCSSNPPLFCPANASTRGQMAVFLARTFGF